MGTATPNRIDDLLSRMTLEEKLAQLGSCWMNELQTEGALDPVKMQQYLHLGIGQITRPGGRTTLPPLVLAQTTNQLQRYLIKETRLGIPAILHEETCCGAMVREGTMFPQPIGLASTFQPALAQAMTTVIRRQMLAIGARQALAPVLDLARDPRWGRIEETFGEDPTLIAHFGVAYVRGLQSDSLKKGVLATGKHFIGHSASQGGLNCAPTHLGWHELYELYFAPFQAVIDEADIATIMNSYPELDGEVVAASRRILTGLLRERLGFEGLIVSDYEAIQMIHSYHKMAPTLERAAALALQAGIEVELPTTVCYGKLLQQALEAGEVELESINQAVRRHLEMKFKLGLFENPYTDENRVVEIYSAPENRTLARDIARQSLVLLKNEQLLPLDRSIGTLAVIGPNAHSGRVFLGDYSYASQRELAAVQVEHATTLPTDLMTGAPVLTVLEAVRALANPATQILYAPGCDNLDPDRSGIAEAVHLAQQADVVLLVLGDRSGLLPHCSAGETRDSASLRLPGAQNDLAQAILDTGKPVIVVLINGRPYAIPELAARADAILEAWLPGEEGGIAIAEALFGEINPGGKLPITFPRSVGQVPIHYNHKPSAMTSNWYGDYVDESVKPLYPFGHGLSYTTFTYELLSITPAQATAGETVTIGLQVTNSGARRGDEVVQLYVHDEYASVPRPVKELKGYSRLTLDPGECRTVLFHLPANQLAFYNHDFDLILEPGRIEVLLGSSAEDIRLHGTLEITGSERMAVGRRIFFCPVEIL
ncbi:MAG: glycoside hydrolase family 3 C-terminal domain-containing protein [Anaerolineae bacterium]|nr:glycoside hydrolase family 3 C-terminal domain-containing protein [Anaerolineae bacterium]